MKAEICNRSLSPEKYQEFKETYEWRKKGINRYYSRFFGFWDVIQTKPMLMYGIDARIIPPASKVRNITEAFFLFPMFLLFPFGSYFSIRKKNKMVVIAALFVLCHWGIHTLIHYNPRYRLPITPLIFFVGFYALSVGYSVLKEKLS